MHISDSTSWGQQENVNAVEAKVLLFLWKMFFFRHRGRSGDGLRTQNVDFPLGKCTFLIAPVVGYKKVVGRMVRRPGEGLLLIRNSDKRLPEGRGEEV